MNRCSGTSADYTVTLPPAASCPYEILGLQMAPIASLSKLVTIDANGSEKIDDQLTRVMWANEVAILLSDGANWTKCGGKPSIPMMACITLASNWTVGTSGVSTVIP